MNRRELVFKLLKRYGECVCCKQDIPEVERVIAFMTVLLENAWNTSLEEAVEQVLRFLESFDDLNDFFEVDFLSGLQGRERFDFLGMVEDRVYQILLAASQRLPAGVEAVAEDSANELLFLAAAAVGGATALQTGTVDSALRTAAVEDIRTFLSGRVVLREQEIRTLARQWVRDPAIRQPLTAAPGLAAVRVAPGGPATRAQWEKALRTAVGLQSGAWLATVTDAWAYRWYSIGAWRSLRRAGNDAIVAWATLDERTTSFCRWVHGKILNTPRIDRQVERHVQAVMAGDVQGMMENWPLITDKALLTGPRNVASFEKAFANVGLPPYHFKCRTVPKRRQL